MSSLATLNNFGAIPGKNRGSKWLKIAEVAIFIFFWPLLPTEIDPKLFSLSKLDMFHCSNIG